MQVLEVSDIKWGVGILSDRDRHLGESVVTVQMGKVGLTKNIPDNSRSHLSSGPLSKFPGTFVR